MSARRRRTAVAAAPAQYRPLELGDASPRGWRAADLPEAGSVLSGTLFAVQRGGETYRQAYGGISSEIKDRALGAMDVGSMAFAEPWQYSLSSHGHAGMYTAAAVSARYGQGEGEPVAVLSVGQPGADGFSRGSYSVVTVYSPWQQPAPPPEPPYGALRFMYAASAVVDDAYIASDEFDGWIYPDGGTYAVDPDQFDPAKNRFITNAGPNPYVSGDTLYAPLFDRFLKANPFLSAAGSGSVLTCRYERAPHHTAMAPHSHLVTGLSASLVLSVDVENSNLQVGTGPGNYLETNAHWGGKAGAEPVYKKVDAEIQLNGVSIDTQEAGDADDEVKPARNTIAVMVYVGGRKKEYERIYA